MGYQGIWDRIKATEERLGEKLLIKTVVGRKGGGSQLVKNHLIQKKSQDRDFLPRDQKQTNKKFAWVSI